jgi:hypothetical protein
MYRTRSLLRVPHWYLGIFFDISVNDNYNRLIHYQVSDSIDHVLLGNLVELQEQWLGEKAKDWIFTVVFFHFSVRQTHNSMLPRWLLLILKLHLLKLYNHYHPRTGGLYIGNMASRQTAGTDSLLPLNFSVRVVHFQIWCCSFWYVVIKLM